MSIFVETAAGNGKASACQSVVVVEGVVQSTGLVAEDVESGLRKKV